MIEPEHLLRLADDLAAPPTRGRPSQIRLRRAISSAYYALFHSLVGAATDLLVGRRERGNERYLLVYRSFEHGEMKKACMRPDQLSYEIQTCARLFLELQAARHEADYDPFARVTSDDARTAIQKAREAIAALEFASMSDGRLFLTRLRFRPRT